MHIFAFSKPSYTLVTCSLSLILIRWPNFDSDEDEEFDGQDLEDEAFGVMFKVEGVELIQR